MANTVAQDIGLEFKGKKAEQERAKLIFGLFHARGVFFAATAPISLPTSSLVEALTSMGEKASERTVESSLEANDHIFARDESGDEVVWVTTKNGVPPGTDEAELDTHLLAERFATPEPPRERPRPQTATFDTGEDELVDEGAGSIEFPPDSWQAAVAAALREAGEPSETVSIAEAADVMTGETAATPEVEEAVEAIEPEAEEVAEEAVEANVEVIEEEPAGMPEPAPRPAVVEAAEVAEIDVLSATDDEIADAIELAMREEPDAVRWGDTWMHESNIPTFSQDDLNKIQEILGAASEAVSDYALVRDLRPDQTPGSEEFELERFAVNYRMSRELGLFEFVGTGRQSLWTTAGQPSTTSAKRKPTEIGQDYRFLLDYRTPDGELEPGLVEHVLTFYEHHHGVLPLNANFATILPKAAFNDQRATRLTFESPQTFETFAVELRYPTTNRGGYIVGFEEFFAENLVPGAVVTIEATRDRETHFIIEYFQISRQDRKLLQFNERRNTFVFQSTTYFCATQDDMLLDDNHFERLEGVEPLDEEARRHVDKVVSTTFERVGTRVEEGDTVRYRAHIVDILAAANIERPISEPYLRDILLGGAYPEFVADDAEEDVFIYVAPAS